MITFVYLAIKHEVYDGNEIKVFQEKEDAINQLKIWVAEELLYLQNNYSEYKKKSEEDEKNCLDWVIDMFKSMDVKEAEGEIYSISWDDIFLEVQEKEIN